MNNSFWNILFSLFFAAIVLGGFSWLISIHHLYYDVPARDLFLVSLAIFRLIRLFSYDIITQFIRDWFVGARVGTFRYTFGTLINCPWCTGLWFSFVVVFFYFATPYAWPIILVLALAAVASFLQVISSLVGWHAEGKKLEVLSKRG